MAVKVLLVIDGLGGGGAQRQMVHLANGLHDRGVELGLFYYHPEEDFFRSALRLAGRAVHVHESPSHGFSLGIVKALRRLIKSGGYTTVIAYLDSPSIYAALASLGLGVRVIVSDRNGTVPSRAVRTVAKRQIYHLVDCVVANTYSQADWLVRRARLPKKKVRTIWNGFPFKEDALFNRIHPPRSSPALKIVGIGRVSAQKNVVSLAKAVKRFQQLSPRSIEVNWAGRIDDRDCYEAVTTVLHGMSNRVSWKWLGPVKDIESLLESHHALVLPSFHEGLPNVVCEALLAARPAIASDIGDNRRLVGTSRGFLYKNGDVNDLCSCLLRFSEIDSAEYTSLCTSAREFAIQNLGVDRMVEEYESLFQ